MVPDVWFLPKRPELLVNLPEACSLGQENDLDLAINWTTTSQPLRNEEIIRIWNMGAVTPQSFHERVAFLVW